ncbi:sigma-54-dependent Fis family transcriptional regulator [bacterium]|nr:sigma-54-dependent Fis family transcriptional regulator [bacterium]
MRDMKRPDTILIIDDDAGLGDTLQDILVSEGYDAVWVGNGADGVALAEERSFDFVLLDLLLPDLSGVDVLDRIVERSPFTTVIMMSGHGTISTALEATRKGAYDWLEKPFSTERVLLTIQRAAERRKLQSENDQLLSEVKDKYHMVGVSRSMQRIFAVIDKVAVQKSTVLITGESGTGKELVARAIHLNSERASAPFIKVNSAAIPDTLIESELFGHRKGSFTHAVSDKKGKFLQADGGTLFLDEIGDLSPSAQAKVLRALEYGEIETIGADRPQQVDVRIIAATNKNLGEMITANRFREDLYHRINLIEIGIPPLRRRAADIPPLLTWFSQEYARQNNRPELKFTAGAITALQSYQWPGNVRELRALVERLFIFSDTQTVSGPAVFAVLNQTPPAAALEGDLDYHEAKKQFEKQYIHNKLMQNGWNVSQTAADMHVARSFLYKKMDEFNLEKVSPVQDGGVRM